MIVRGRPDKYLASPPDGATIARKIYYRVVHCHRRLLSKFQPNRTRSFVLTACGSVVSADFRLPPWQRTGSHLRRRHGQIGRIRLRTAAPSIAFSRFGRVRLLFVSKLEKDARRAGIWVEWGGYRRHGGLLCRPPENVFFRRVKKVGASLGQVYRVKRRLCWEINRHFSNIFVFRL